MEQTRGLTVRDLRQVLEKQRLETVESLKTSVQSCLTTIKAELEVTFQQNQDLLLEQVNATISDFRKEQEINERDSSFVERRIEGWLEQRAQSWMEGLAKRVEDRHVRVLETYLAENGTGRSQTGRRSMCHK